MGRKTALMCVWIRNSEYFGGVGELNRTIKVSRERDHAVLLKGSALGKRLSYAAIALVGGIVACAPGDGGCIQIPFPLLGLNPNTPPPRPSSLSQEAQVTGGLSMGLDGWANDLDLQEIGVAGTGSSVGSNTEGNTAALDGQFTITLEDQLTGETRGADLSVEDGEVLELSLNATETEEAFQLSHESSTTAKAMVDGVLIGCSVSSADGEIFRIILVAILDTTEDGLTFRERVVFDFIVGLGIDRESLVGVGRETREVIDSNDSNRAPGDSTSIIVTVGLVQNEPPTARAGEDQTVVDDDGSGREFADLDGSASSDPDGRIVAFRWSDGDRDIADEETPTVLLDLGENRIVLTVTDEDGAEDSDEVIVTVVSEGTATPTPTPSPTSTPTPTPTPTPAPIDLCPNDPDKIDPGECGCGVPDTDTDNDGTPDCNDNTPQGVTTATIVHRGSEHIVAGANADPTVSLQTPDGYAPGGFGGSGAFGTRTIALSGDGQKIWVAMFDTFPNVDGDPQTLLYSLNTDGTGGMRSSLPVEDIRNGLHLSTNLDGSVVIANNPRLGILYRATPGAPATQVFDQTPVGADIRGNMKLADDASSLIILSFNDSDAVHMVDLMQNPAISRVIATWDDFTFLDLNPVGINNIFMDASSDLSRWIVSMRVFSGAENRNRWPVYVGSGLTNPTIQVQDVPNDFDGVGALNITDDGSVISYCLGLSGTNPCFLHDVGAAASTRTVVMDDVTTSGNGTLSDDGGTMYQQTNICCGGGESYIYDVASGARRLPSSQTFTGSANVRFGGTQFSDDGSIFAAPLGVGAYVLNIGVDGLANFPSIDQIEYGFNDDDCTLVVRLEVTAPRGVDRIYTLPLFKGMEPNRTVPEPENPFFFERGGGGINKSTTFTEVEGEPGVWERTISLSDFEGGCKKSFIDGDYNLRIILVDANGTQAVFQDFAPLP
jgi:hypothetical protein